MVGHTGDFAATVEAITHIDDCVGRLMASIARSGGAMLLTADHGNADQMKGIDKKSGAYTDEPHTSHSLNPVPVWLYDPAGQATLRTPSGPTVTGGIAQIGASLLSLFGLPAPKDYLPSLIQD